MYALAAQIYSLYIQADWVARQAFPQTAEGEYLDCHAQLRSLERKGAVSCRQGERAREYTALLEREKAAARETDSFLSRVYGGSLGLMVNSMLRANSLSEAELQELRELLDRG